MIILVVEDNESTRTMLRVALGTEGYAVLEAPDVRSALAMASEHLPDLVLQDLTLPDGDSIDLAHRLRELPGGAELPIVALSAFASRIPDAHTLALSAILLKPVEPTRLLETIRALLPQRTGPALAVGEGRHVLLVDDDPVQLKLIRIHLTQLGFRVTSCSTASEALRFAHEQRPDVILTDVLMPEVDGFQLCYEIRSEPKLSSVPVVLLSAHYHADPDRGLADRVGASALVLRTPALEELGPTILRALQSSLPATAEEPSERVQLEHAKAVIRQLDRQIAASAGLGRRTALQAAQLALLGGIAEALTRKSEIQAVLRDVLAATLDAAAISQGALFLRGPEGTLALRHAIGFTAVSQANLASFFGHAELLEELVARKLPASIPSAALPPAAAQAILAAADAASAEIVPLVSGERAIGAIVLGARRTDLASEDSVVFIRAIGHQVVQALELEAAFAELAASELRYRTLMQSANDAILILTPEGVIREANRRTEEMLGLPRESIVGRHIRDFAAPGREVENVETFGRALPGEGRTAPVGIKRADGSIVLIEFSTTPLELAGERLVFTIGRDVTEQVRSHAQLIASDRMASIGMLAAAVAHEINNPLAAVTANLELAAGDVAALAKKLASTAELGELEEEIREAREAAQRVRAIVRDLKVFSRSEDEHQSALDVHRVLDSTLRMASNEIRHRAQLVKDYGNVPFVVANESRLGQVFLNLVVNAAQAISEGRADAHQIRVRTRAEHGEVVIEVSDTGSGMSPETLKKLFTPFFTTKPRGLGTGLGLTICERIVAGLGGRIGASSTLGQGATFRVFLPSALTDELESEPGPRMPSTRATRRGHILVVDDDPLVGAATRRLLKADHDVIMLSSAQAALERIVAGERFDVILCDLMMPVMTGMELHTELVRIARDQAECMVFLSGGAFTPRARAFLDEIENPRLEKPFETAMLREIVASRLR